MKIHFLGTGEAVPNIKRQNTCLFFQEGDDHILVDGHAHVSALLKADGFDYTQIEHVFITHYHIDHISGLLNLFEHIFVTNYLRSPENIRRTKTLNLYGNAKALEMARSLLRLFGHYDGDSSYFPVVSHELPMTDHEFMIGKLKINTFPAKHGHTTVNGPTEMPVLGLAVTGKNGKKAIYSADTMPNQPVYDMAEAGDILIHECNSVTKLETPVHTSLHQLKQIMPSLKVDKLYLVHLPYISDEDETALEQSLNEEFDGRMVICKDRQIISF